MGPKSYPQKNGPSTSFIYDKIGEEHRSYNITFNREQTGVCLSLRKSSKNTPAKTRNEDDVQTPSIANSKEVKMDLRDVTMTRFVQLQSDWSRTNCLALLGSLQPSRAIIAQESVPDEYYLLEATDLAQLLVNTPYVNSLVEALATTNYLPVPALEASSAAKDAPEQCVVLEDGYLIGFFDTNLLADWQNRKDELRDPGVSASLEFQLSSLIVARPETIPLDSVVSVLILLSNDAIVDAKKALPLNLPPGTVIDIIIMARHRLVCEGETEGQLTIPDKEESLPLQFRLRGVEPGPGKFIIFAFYNRQPLGALYLDIHVESASHISENEHRKVTCPLQSLDAYVPGLSQLTLERNLMGKRGITPSPPLRRPRQHDPRYSTDTMGSRPQIVWQDCEPEQLVQNLQHDQTFYKTNPQWQKLLAEELHTLLVRLFSDAEIILVAPLTPGFSGAKVLKVQPFISGGGGGGVFVVKFGKALAIEQEFANYQQYVFFFNKSGRYTAAFKWEQTAEPMFFLDMPKRWREAATTIVASTLWTRQRRY
jgi:hypothetical protein